MNLTAILFCAAVAAACAAVAAPDEKAVISLEAGIPDALVRNSVTVELLKSGPQQGLRVRYGVTDWPNAFFRPVTGVWDWSGWTGIAVDIYNPEAEAQAVSMRVDNAGADGVTACNQLGGAVKAGEWTTFRLRFNKGGDKGLWGMRGLPVTGPTGGGAVLDLSKITAFQVFLAKPTREHTLILRNFRLYGPGDASVAVKYPFVDRFGQYRNAEWPGKLHSETELRQRLARETAELKAAPRPADRDGYGGWASGPKRQATGWFRTEKIDGKWWLVTPDGRLFFSNGVDCVGPGEYTFIDGRDRWFEWLPEDAGPYGRFIARQEGVHSMAEAIGGKGRTFSFYCANLVRKHGSDWRREWERSGEARLRAWGFNTVGNWSDWDFMSRARIPFTASGGVSGTSRRIEGGGGYWAKMVDVFDPGFPAAAEEGLSGVAQRFAKDPFCIGYFGDNEISWDAVERGPLASPPDQPCRVAQVAALKAKYATVEKLNAAWGTSAASWEALRVPESPNAACRGDLDDFIHAFARRYFEVCKAVFRKHAPNQLYLGCRFAWAPRPAVRACAEVADVVSFNIYQGAVNPADFTGANDLGKPILIGEFHFGALDRGMFHEGLGPRVSQQERAEAYLTYVRSVADCPSFVGCHWFQYIDEPLTGRWFDGENYNIGLVDVTDTPYPELIAAARKAHAEVYARHSKAK